MSEYLIGLTGNIATGKSTVAKMLEELGATVIDADALEAGGVHWLAWGGEGFEVRPAIPDRNRPWRPAL